MNTKYKFFWKSFSPFSNWYKCNFIHFGKEFTSSEQAMMYMKAVLFNDKKIAEQILNTNEPKLQKELGRKIKDFDENIWNNEKYQIVKNILHNKFNQNPKLKLNLLKYKGYEFVEASPFDRIWGIGYREEDALKNIDNWGENLLGKILTELSNKL